MSPSGGGRRWSALLHFAASRGLRRVALFLLRQPAAREALRQRDAQGDTPASLARRKGHQQLAELFTRCETSAEDIQEGSEGWLQVYPEGRALQCHPGLGTHTLTLPARQEKESEEVERGDGQRGESRLLKGEVEELRRLVQIHREQKGKLDFCDSSSPIPGSTHLPFGHGLCNPAGRACPKSNGQSERQEPAQPAVEAPEKCCKATEMQASDCGFTVADIAPCNTESPRPNQEEKAAGGTSPVVGRQPTRSRKNRKRTSKSRGNDKSATRTPEKAINNPTEITGSNSELNIVLPKELIGEGKSTSSSEPARTPFPIVPLSGTVCDAGQVVVTTSVAKTVEKQEDGNSELCLETSARATKREDLSAKQTNQNHPTSNICATAKWNLPSEGNPARKGSMGQGQSLNSEDNPGEPTGTDPVDQSTGLGQRDGPDSPGPLPRRMLWRDGGWTATMGWSTEQGPETPANTVWYQDESPARSPTEGAALASHGKEALAHTTWYGENMAENQTLTSLASVHGHPEESEQKESALSQPRASVVCSAGDSLEHDPCFQVSVSALSQVGDPGAQPAQSHVPGAQRQEAYGKQRDQGGRGDGEVERKERGADGGADGGARGGDDRRRANSEESIEREEEGAEETADKGRKKRRRKRGRRGAAEAKLSSSSSTESHVLMDTLAEAGAQSQSHSPTADTQAEIRAPPDRERDPKAPGSGAALGGDPPSAERLVATETRPVAQAGAGRAASQPPCPSESVLREEVDAGTMRLPSQTGDKSMDCSKPIVALSDTDSHSPGPSLARSDSGSKEVRTILHVERPDLPELPYFTEPVEWDISVQPVEFKSQAEKIEATVSDLDVDVDDVVPTELDYGHSDTTESKGAFDAVLLSEQNAEPAAAMELNNCSNVEALEIKPNSVDQSVGQLPQCVTTIEPANPTEVEWLLDSETTETSTCMAAIQHEGAPPVEPPQQGEEGAADVSSLKTPEGTADGTVTADLGHCFGHVGPPRDGPSEDKPSEVKGSEVRGGREEMREACIMERHSDEVVVAASAKSCVWNKEERKGEEVIESSAEVHDNGENENSGEAENRCMDGEDNLRYNEELAATAVAVVSVAVASALAKIELSKLSEAEWSKESSQTGQTPIQASSVLSSEHKLPLDTTVQVSVCVNQLTNDLQAELASTPTTSKSHACHELSDTDDYCPSDEKVSADEEYQQKKVAEPQDVERILMSNQSVPEAGVILEESPEANIINTELVISEAISVQNFCLDLSHDLTIKASSLAVADTKTYRDLNEALAAQPASPINALSEGQLCQDNQVPCPVIDTGQGNGKQLDWFDSNATENPGLKECADDSPGELDCFLSEELLGIRLNPGHGAKTPLVGHVLVNESGEAGKSQGTSKAVAAIEPASEACVTGQEGTVVFVCEEGEGEIHQDGSAGGQRLPLESEVCSSGVPPSEIQSKNSYMGAVSSDDEEYSMPACEVILPVNPDHSLSGTGSGTAHSSPLSKESTSPVTPDDGTTQPLADMFVLATPMEFQSSSLQHQGVHSAVMYDGDGMFQDQGGHVGYLDTVDGCKDQERTSDGEETQRIMVTTPDASRTQVREALQEEQPPETISEGALHPEIQRDKETFFPLGPCPEPNTLPGSCTPPAPVTDRGLSAPWEGDEVDRMIQAHPATTHDAVERLTPSVELDDCVFKKPAPPGSRPELRRGRSSWSSTDDSSSHRPPSVSSRHSVDTASMDTASMDTASMDTASMDSTSVGASDSASLWSPGGPWKSDEEGRGCTPGIEGLDATGGEEEEGKDHLPDNSVTSAILRASNRSLSPFRRHSWESGRANVPGPPGDPAEPAPAQRSSQRILPVEVRRAKPPLHRRSFSLEGLEVGRAVSPGHCPRTGAYDRDDRSGTKGSWLDNQERGGGSLVSLTEEEQEGDASSPVSQSAHRELSMQTSCPTSSHHPPLTKSISMVAISQRETDGVGSFSTTAGSLEYSICEEEPGPLRSNSERGGVGGGVGGTKVSRTFSYLRSKMSKKSKGSDKEKRGEKEREGKEREKRPVNGHAFSPASPPPSGACPHCGRLFLAKDTFLCTNCGVHVHKNCRENLSICAKAKMKQQLFPTEAATGTAVNLRSKSSSSASSLSSSSSASLTRDRWSTLPSTEDQVPQSFPRRNPNILSFNTHSNLSKSISTSNIAGLDDVSLKGQKHLSRSTDNLHQGSKVNASTESLTDEGTEMMDSQLMGEFECDVKELEADSWSATVDKKFLKLHKKDEVKRQDVIYELFQTELHHVRTLRIMSEVYYKGLQKELQLDTQTLEKVFPMLDDLLETHTHFLTLLLERKRFSQVEGRGPSSFLIDSIGDILVNQFSGCNADRMKKVYGKFCSRHNEAVNLYKELHAKDKRFQALIKRLMSSSIVRRLSIPECVLLVTQRITKYPVLIQRILQHTKDTDEDHACVSEALRCVKELIAAVDSKVNEQEKKTRLREVYSRTDSKSIMRMKSGQMFAKEDLIRGRRLLHDGTLQLKNAAGRLKDVHAMLLSDVLVFLQEKDQKYVFASLDQRSTVISIQKLIVREVANEERGLFLITAGTNNPEMVNVLASSKDERNTWMSIIQDAMHCIEKEEDEGVPSETEEDRRQQETRAKESRELLRLKDQQIVLLLKEKVNIFKDLCDLSPALDEGSQPIGERMLFRATPDEVTKGEPIIKDALKEVESLHTLVNSSVGGAGGSTTICLTGGTVGPVCLPRRAETFGGFDSHQMNSSKSGEKEEGDDALDLRRTESDSVLKKGANTSLQMLLKRNNEQVQHSVGNLYNLLTSLQAVVVQQDSFVEDQRLALSERLAAQPPSRNSSSSSLSQTSGYSSSSRPSSLIEQEKQRSLERQRQEAASLQKQQAAHQEERRRREREWEAREQVLGEREAGLRAEEEAAAGAHAALGAEREELQRRKEDYQRDLERLREAQRRLEREREALRRETERLEALRSEESGGLQKFQRTSSSTSEESLRFHSSSSLDQESREAPEAAKEVELSSSAPTKEPFLRIGSKRMGKNFNPFSSSSSSSTSSSSKPQGGDKDAQLPNRLLQLAKTKPKKEKKKKGKGGEREETGQALVMSEPHDDGEVIFC
ncbi:A-kinase anchor protein 13 isoform X1 [Gadus macrocephalus]|uniref:A-kinase anchor protein 13 isoform X1 n=1 Tax=Gadus macrocephalus TaxID=80720 RepID=UPI0028CB27DD|nr:A-kinase anchor protein 13 isoform X1 [Gadus macrocephalus]